MTLHQRTHIDIDGKVHKIVEIAEQNGARHTHRVHTGCGLTIDVDHEGAKHKAAAAELHAQAAEAKLRKDHGLMREYTERAQTSLEQGKRHEDDVSDDKGRWRTHDKPSATCQACIAVEAGGARFVPEEAFNPPASTKPMEK